MKKFDITVIGAGPGGYVAALYAAGCGKKVLVLEEDELGGVCLNRGCIPTKTLITSVKALKYIKRSKEFGITVGSHNIDYEAIKVRKDRVVEVLKAGIKSLFKARNIESLKGHAKLLGKGVVGVGNDTYESRDIIIATGSRPVELPNLRFNKKNVLTSADMLRLDRLPKNLFIVGGGVNGCEFAYTYANLGVKVAVAEMAENLLPNMDRELGRNMEVLLKKTGVKVLTKTKIDRIPPGYDRAVVCIGRRANIEKIGLENLNIEASKKGVAVDKGMRTNIPDIYAVGDVTGGYLLAHTASHEGIVACGNIIGEAKEMDYRGIPLCIYTDPQIASVGLTKEEAQERGLRVKVSRFPFMSVGKTHVINERGGFIKLVGDEETGEVLGIHMVGPEAGLLAAEAALIVKKRMQTKDVAELVHAHPTLSEVFTEAAFQFNGRPLHTL